MHLITTVTWPSYAASQALLSNVRLRRGVINLDVDRFAAPLARHAGHGQGNDYSLEATA